MFSYSSGPESLNISAGRFQPSKMSVCFAEKEKTDVSLPYRLELMRMWLTRMTTRVPYVKGGSSSRLLRKTAGSGSASQGGKTLPWSFEERSRMVFSPVGSSRVWRGCLSLSTFGTGDEAGVACADAGGNGRRAGVLSVSASAMSSWHLRLRRDFSAAVGASLTAPMYNSAASMA